MQNHLSLEQIRDYWTQQARTHGKSSDASWTDTPAIDLELRELVSRINDGDRILDVGCANGYTTLQYAAARSVVVRGLDYIPEMVHQANERLGELSSQLSGRVEFAVGDITNLKEPDASYDKVIVIRVVINLENWDTQARALHECARVVKPGGLLLLSEATLDGWRKLNRFRAEWGMPEIPMPGFNQYLDEQRVIAELSGEMDCVEVSNFASSYYVGTRVIKPLLARALGCEANVANPDAEFNRWCAQWPASGDYGTQKLFVFRKKA